MIDIIVNVSEINDDFFKANTIIKINLLYDFRY